MNKLEVTKFIDMQVDGINHRDAPDYCDAYISYATAILVDGSMRSATDEELEVLSSDGDLVYSLVEKRLY